MGRGARRTTERRERSRRPVLLVAGLALLVLVAGPIIGFFLVYTAPSQEWFARVNGVAIPRTALVDVLRANQIDASLEHLPFDARAQAFDTATLLIENEVLRQKADTLGVAVSEEDVERELAAQLAPQLDPADLDTSGRAELAEAKRQYADLRRLDVDELERLAEGELLRREATEALGRSIPDPQPQLRLHSIVVADVETAARIESEAAQGVPFEELVRRYSFEPAAGDLGWLPYDALPPAAADLLWSLPPLEFAPPFQREDGAIVVYVVSTRDPSRELDPVARQLAEEVAFESWLGETLAAQEVELQLDSETLEWVAEQLAQTPSLGPRV
ncbi:MAG: SurA N-terminal domain-containing protein [Chloroflexi bacterium]|nr:SurA N-terminal domain-containing protein [Chloroflexota bacterium]